jgi:hypothetical protein
VKRLYLTGLGFVCGGLVAFSTILNCWFLSDDFAQIGKVLAGDYSVVWGRAQGGFFRPLFILSYMIDGAIWGARPFGFHLTNVVVHSLNAFLTVLLSLKITEDLRLSLKAKQLVAIGAGVLFLLHPSHTEAVSWISGRADLLATFFCLASLITFLTYARSGRASRLVASLLCFMVALLAKESAICLPFLITVLAMFINRAQSNWSLRRWFAITALYFSILVLFVAVRAVFIGSLVGGYGASQHLNFAPGWLRDRLLEAAVRSVLPPLPIRWSWILFKPLQSPAFILIALVCAAILVGAILFRRKQYARTDRREQNIFLLALLALFLFSLSPVINLRLTLYHTHGERFLYLPTVFSCLLLAYVGMILIRNWKLFVSILICVLGFYSVRLYQTNGLWVDAAHLSRSIVDGLVASSTSEHAIVLNVPDNVRGVPVFHNGLPEALEYFQNRKRFTQVEIAALQDFDSAADEVALTALPGTVTLHALNDNDILVRAETPQCVDVTTPSRTSLEVQLKPCVLGTDLFFFDRGRMLRVPGR